MTKVKCKVSSCHYWDQGDVCTADTILIDQDQMRTDTTRMEVSSLDIPGDRGTVRQERTEDRQKDRTRADEVRTSEGTCCRTFRPKGSPKLT